MRPTVSRQEVFKYPFFCSQLSALEKDLTGLKSPSNGDVAAVLDSYQEQVSDGVLFCLLPKHSQLLHPSVCVHVIVHRVLGTHWWC